MINYIYNQLYNLQGWFVMVSDCEELVRGLVTRNNGVKFIVGIAAYSIADCIS